MKRPESHKIDGKAQKILMSQVPDEWVCREQKPDYGIDYEVQVFNGDDPTDTWFRIQLKGIKKPRETKDSINFSLKTGIIKYYLSKVPFPVFLFVVNVSTKEIYWIFLQKYVNEILKVENPEWHKQETITIRIPKENIFKNNSKKIEIVAREGMKYTNLLVFGIPDWSTSFEVKNAIDNIDKFRSERDKHLNQQNKMDIELGFKYHKALYEEESREMFNEVINRTKNKERDILMHLSAIEGLIFTYSVIDEKENFEAFKLADFGYELAEKIQDKHFMYLFKGIHLEAVYYKLVEKMQTYNIMRKMNAQKNEYVNLINLFQSADYKDLIKVSKQYLGNLRNSFEDREYWVSLALMLFLIKMNLDPYYWLIVSRTKEELKPLLENVSSLIEDAIVLADSLDAIEFKCEILECKALLFHFQNKNYKKILEEMKVIANENNLEHFIKLSKDLLEEFNKESPYPEGPDDFKEESIYDLPDEELSEMLRVYANRLGINNVIANEIIRVGVKDLNPERILKNCSHIEITYGHHGIYAEMLGLPSAGDKVIFCRYGKGEFGSELDYIYESFKDKYCKNCKHHDPKSKEWKWSLEREKGKQMSDEFQRFIDEINEKFSIKKNNP